MKTCPITKWPTIDYSKTIQISYGVRVHGKHYFFDFCKKCFDLIDFKKYGKDIFGLIINERFIPDNHVIHWEVHNKEDFSLKDFLSEANYPRTPKEKLDNLLIQLNKNQNQVGDTLFPSKIDNGIFHARCFFDSFNEMRVYLEALNSQRLIDYKPNDFVGDPTVKVEFEGLSYLAELEDSGAESNNCFIAMAFDKKTEKIRDAIKNAIVKTGFNPMIIDEEHLPSDQTINDAIIAGIKKSKFCISDFTLHRNGVYFESGFALGLGRPVIYCCEETEFKKAHFDIKPLQHIIYKTEVELEKRLIDKIEAWIK